MNFKSDDEGQAEEEDKEEEVEDSDDEATRKWWENIHQAEDEYNTEFQMGKPTRTLPINLHRRLNHREGRRRR